MKPSTPLPWARSVHRKHYSVDSIATGQRVSEVRSCKGPNGHDTYYDAAYIAHAANAYPKLIAALNLAYARLADKAAREEIGALLNELEPTP